MLNQDDLYPIANECKSLLIPIASKLPIELRLKGYMIMGKLTGEYRQVKPGEWFLSGALPECYYNSSNELSMKYHIVMPVLVQEIKSFRLVKILGE